MPRTPAELRKEARGWLNALGKRYPLQRRLYLVPGICNEDSAIWDTMRDWGRRVIPNWDAYCRPIQFLGVQPNADFIDLGAHLRREIGKEYPDDPASAVGEYDLVCFSMGGPDAFSALIPLGGRHGDVPAIAPAFNFITLDSPFGGVPNWRQRQQFADMNGRPDRQSQCASIAPESPQLALLRAARAQLAGRAERMVCYSALGDSAVQVPLDSSNIAADRPASQLWGAVPRYASYLIPGASHAGASAIYLDEYAIASVFGSLLFNQ